MRIDPDTHLRLGPAAADAEQELVWRLRAFLRDGQATAGEIATAIGISPRALEMLAGVGLLEPAPQARARCERCGAPVRVGTLCGRCRAGLAAPLAAGDPGPDAGSAADDPVARAIAASRAARRMPAPGSAPGGRLTPRIWTRRGRG
jgi:hypothetical protein